jgi:hypothetical protein
VFGLSKKNDLKQLEKRIMEAIQQFSARVTAAFARIGTSVDGIHGDITQLKQLILDLQNSPGTLTPEDQAALDVIETLVSGLETRVSSLDAETGTSPTPNP